ncbi:MAG: hypothetical protein CYPHOPRED_000301 [Cyphobasidiales sp. Tagirdzhanova-0007]|nr:MAG: hypothetical protein CYPHOPRED_000301 [Cyphobasidiales sp. Tagirdzhanova-0007]
MLYSGVLTLGLTAVAAARPALPRKRWSPNPSFLRRNCVFWGWIGEAGNGTAPAELNQDFGVPAKYFGVYGHANGTSYEKDDPSTYFNGSEVLTFIDYLNGTGSTVVLAIMPIDTFDGFTVQDNTQALNVVKVLQQFNASGIPTYLRFAHEPNRYRQPNTSASGNGAQEYGGNASDYLAAWNVMAAAVKANASYTQMVWSPAFGSGYLPIAPYWPGPETVDIDFYDTYAKANHLPFQITETASALDDTSKLEWVLTVTSNETCSSLTQLEAVTWFNYDVSLSGLPVGSVPGLDFRLTRSKPLETAFTAIMATKNQAWFNSFLFGSPEEQAQCYTPRFPVPGPYSENPASSESKENNNGKTRQSALLKGQGTGEKKRVTLGLAIAGMPPQQSAVSAFEPSSTSYGTSRLKRKSKTASTPSPISSSPNPSANPSLEAAMAPRGSLFANLFSWKTPKSRQATTETSSTTASAGSGLEGFRLMPTPSPNIESRGYF